jgi:hypothetical protein
MEHEIDFVDWDELKGKEARGIGGKVDLGEVQGIGRNYVITKKGIASKETFYIPKYLAQGYDGKKVYFDVREGQKEEFKRENPPTYEEYSSRYRQEKMPANVEEKVIVVDETPVLVEEPDVVVETTTVEPAIAAEPPVINWDSVIHKNVRTLDGEPVGNVVALYPDSIHVETQASKAGYDIPKEEVAAFDGAELRLSVPIADMNQFLEHK